MRDEEQPAYLIGWLMFLITLVFVAAWGMDYYQQYQKQERCLVAIKANHFDAKNICEVNR